MLIKFTKIKLRTSFSSLELLFSFKTKFEIKKKMFLLNSIFYHCLLLNFCINKFVVSQTKTLRNECKEDVCENMLTDPQANKKDTLNLDKYFKLYNCVKCILFKMGYTDGK